VGLLIAVAAPSTAILILVSWGMNTDNTSLFFEGGLAWQAALQHATLLCQQDIGGNLCGNQAPGICSHMPLTSRRGCLHQ
jgi:hypothetical protein